ncbi:MAG: thioredoxin family protein [Bacteroidia bacterium]|nr:thioredoxin family protein [Bacteroidia bacterium]MCZ2140776.1 thioredoxin family protein [Bacteroidia bacterium]
MKKTHPLQMLVKVQLKNEIKWLLIKTLNHMKKFLFIPLFIICLTTTAQINFVKFNSLNELFKEAKKQQKNIFIDGYTNWCGWCKELDKVVFSNKVFADTIHKYFIPIKLEMEKDSLGVIIARKYAVIGFPQAIILDNEGRLIKILNGYSPLERYFMRMQEALADCKQNRFIAGYSTNFSQNYPEFYIKQFPMPGIKKEKRDSTTINLYLTKQKNWANETVWNVIRANYYLLNSTNQNLLRKKLPELAKLFGKAETEELYISAASKQINQMQKVADETEFIITIDSLTNSLDEKWWYMFQFKKNYYEEHKDYKKLALTIDEYLNNKKEKSNVSIINETAWNLYLHCNDTGVLTKAITWMHDFVLLNDPLYMYIDTYAALLYKTGKLNEAKAQAILAIKVGKADNENTEETEKLLDKIKLQLQSK